MKQLTERPVNDVYSTTRTVTAVSQLQWLLAFLVFASEENPFPLDQTTHFSVLRNATHEFRNTLFSFLERSYSKPHTASQANGTLSVTGEVTHTAFSVPCSQTVNCLLFVARLSSVFFFIVPKQQSAPLVSMDDRSYSFNVTLSSAFSILYLSIGLTKTNESFHINLISNINPWRTKRNKLYLKIQSVPLSKIPSISVTTNFQFIYRKIITVCSKIRREHKTCSIYRVIRNNCRGFNNFSYTIHLR